jgi:ethanolamine ammonia-lyase large subunit
MTTTTAALAFAGALALAPSVAAAGTDDEPESITVEVVDSITTGTGDVRVGIDVTIDGDLAAQLDITDPSHFVVWITMKPAADGTFAHLDDCPGVPGSADDFVPGTRRIPVC